MVTEMKDKLDKAKARIEGLVQDAVKSSIGSVLEEFKGSLITEFNSQLDSFKEEVTEQRKIKFDPLEAAAPYVTSGPLGDKGGYSFLRIIQAQLSHDWKKAKVERGVHDELCKYGYGRDIEEVGYWVTPLNCDGLPLGISSVVKSMMVEAVGNVEAKDVRRLLTKVLGMTNDQLGGYLVEPVQAPEIIELLRPQVAVQRAGAREMPLPVSGQLDVPRQTGGVDAQWVGENENIRTRMTTNAQFGQLLLRAKKLATFQQLSTELVTSSTPAAEAIIRSDMASKIAEVEDLTWLQGAGTQSTPMGIINHSTVTTFTPTTVGANGNTYEAQDIQLFVGAVEEQNAVMQAWIMRPKMLAVLLSRRAEGGQTANAGPFLFDIVKDPTNKAGYLLGGYPVYTTTQVSGSRVKGSGTTLTYLVGGMFTDCVIGRKATLEIKASAEAGTAFETDQVWLRGITRSDFGLRHASAIVFSDQLLQS